MQTYTQNYMAIYRLSRHLCLQTPGYHIDMIKPGGKCLCRSISKEILRTEKCHSKVRKQLWYLILDHLNTGQNWTECGAACFTTHVQSMRKARLWATKVEIIAASTFFNTSIFTERVYRRVHWRSHHQPDIGQFPANTTECSRDQTLDL